MESLSMCLCLCLYILISFVLYPTSFSIINNSSASMNHLCRQDESQLLLQLKQQLHHDPHPSYPRDYPTLYWNSSRDCCEWYGVICDYFTGHVIGLDLGWGHLRGNLKSNSSLFHLTHLRSLNLARNNFSDSTLPPEFGRLNALRDLDLSDTGFAGEIPVEFYHLSKLVSLNLANDASTDYKIRCDVKMLFGNMTRLRVLRLTNQNLSNSDLPINISSSFLTHLGLSSTGLRGELPATIFEKSNMQWLELGGNEGLEGRLPDSIGLMSNLYYMYLSHCNFSGPIPESIGNITGISRIYLSSNSIQGRIGKLNSPNLFYLDLSSNRLNIEIESFYNHSGIEFLKLSHNTVTEHGGDIINVTNFLYLSELEMSSCEIKEFPNILRSNMPYLQVMDLSNNIIHGPIPSWFTSNLSETLSYLDLSANFFTNYPWRTFPPFICNLSQLLILNLSHNKLSGNILECLPNSTTSLRVLDLSRNEFHGKIPTKIGTMYQNLSYLGLNGNHLEGPLPRSLANCARLKVIDLGNNLIKDTFPQWLDTLPQLKILILKSNRFHGSITPPLTNNSFSNLQIFDLSYNNFTGLLPEKLFASLGAIKNQSQVSPDERLYMEDYEQVEFDHRGHYNYFQYSVTISVKGEVVEFTKVLKILNTIDLSSNNFKGCIPESISYLASLRLLNLSHNSINGSIPPALGRMTNLEHLDLSGNQLTGGIPQSLTSLTFLEVLNLSHNHLVGPIPLGNQFSTFSNDSYAANSGLCGDPLTRSCGNGTESPSAEDFEEKDEDDGFMMGFTWKAVVMGYGCGILLGFILGNVMISIKKPRWLERFVYVEAAIILRRRKKRRRTVQGRT
ncbi:hypothetical protein ACS0TY_022754 [Phlomoides rotata]